MIDLVFERLSRNPHALFTEDKLRKADADGFDDFVTTGLIKRGSLDYSRATVLRGGRVLRVVGGPDDSVLQAIDDDDLDFDPVNVRIEDVLLWEFDVVAWAAEFNRRFDIRGPATRLDDRIWQLGTFGSASLVFLILAHSDSVTEALLRSLPTVRGVPPVVLLPSRTTAPEFGTIGGALLARLTAGGFGAEPSIEQVIRATPTAGFVEPVPGFRHSADFRSAQWNGQSFSLTPQQAQVVEMLLDAWLNGTPDLGQGYLLDRIGTTANELRFTFRDSPAWGTLVVGGGTRGSFRLAL